jgi:hypothetical protein
MMKWLVFASLAATPASAAAAQECELHVWPAQSSGANNGGWLSNLGVPGALADYERNKDLNLRDQVALIEVLTPPAQAKIMADEELATALGMAGARTVFESRPLPRREIRKLEQRLSAFTGPCYAELIVTLNFYQKSALHGRMLTSHFLVRDFRTDASRPRLRKKKESSRLTDFPADADAAEAAARQDLLRAFADNMRTLLKDMPR